MIEVKQLALDWLRRPLVTRQHDAIERVGPFFGVTLARRGQFQVQVWYCPPLTRIPLHAHPHADGVTATFEGEMAFAVNGRVMRARDTEVVSWWGRPLALVPVPANAPHQARIGSQGAAFLAFSLWLDRRPCSVHLDWDGEPMDAAHAAQLSKE